MTDPFDELIRGGKAIVWINGRERAIDVPTMAELLAFRQEPRERLLFIRPGRVLEIVTYFESMEHNQNG